MSTESGHELARRLYRRLDPIGGVSNGLGAVVVALFLAFLAPNTIDNDEAKGLLLRGGIAFAAFTPVAMLFGRYWVELKSFRRIARWLREERPATEEERLLVLRYPLEWAAKSALIWLVAAVYFASVTATGGAVVALGTLLTTLLGGLTAAALQYLLVERTLRPVTERALAGGPPPSHGAPGIGARLTMTWILVTGVPLFGIAAWSVADLLGADFNQGQIIAAMLFLALAAMALGLVAMSVAARSVADPVEGVRHALEKVQEGDFEARVTVDAGGGLGLLQAGFNRMAVGLEERERIHDLFGRHVGKDVAREALAGEVSLGGEVRRIAALFVDLVGSTSLAARLPPTEVVSLLNAFFAIVVQCVERHSGWVNKFEGDAALCVFGAPTARDDPSGDALAAARELRGRLLRELPYIDVGIGVSAGEAVAGNVGAEERYEYTVIGDPVNEAARLCELAKTRPERVLASGSTIEDAAAREARHWTVGEAVTLRGRPEETPLATVAS